MSSNIGKSIVGAYRNLYRELSKLHRTTAKAHIKETDRKLDAMVKYKKIQLIREGKNKQEIDNELNRYKEISERMTSRKRRVNIAQEKGEFSGYLEDFKFSEGSAHKLIYNISIFLKNQRVYEELIERYNPGITMSQEEKVQKTANRVGLQVPE
ncbi:Fmc1p ASCRUDRAFT_75950 [Ascoidea rubescens DSM 1968]|uniref:Uncharacterized protein n=1 Tax=Ascoidea rubescens DSM 1968 TaxID=1344418 RepID=A0A1D2VHY6_9ASCO|nr:hypothetical protein ASCRUDRAFT_75950 [Ascoidea rubescens DSM 1968]ODV61256.1 hypothetical protein ASCRUDRAFT_75950 [Ascoidea rubescens DSM 1968]